MSKASRDFPDMENQGGELGINVIPSVGVAATKSHLLGDELR